MLPDFSEFSYGFAFAHEYVTRNPGLKAAPELPSLVKEAETGHDLKLGYRGHSKYFQFKLSAFLNRRNTIHWKDHLGSHYRVRVTTRPRYGRPSGTDQHTRLKRLATTVDDVFYVAPRFHSEYEFNGLFAQARVTDNSLWAPLKDLPWVTDDDVHFMTFTRNQKKPWWHSEVVELKGDFTAEEHYGRIRETVTIDENFFKNLRGKLRAAVNDFEWQRQRVSSADDNEEIASVLRETHELLTTQFGLQMITLTEEGS